VATGTGVAASAFAYGRLLVGGATLLDTATGAATPLDRVGAGPVAVGVSLGEARAALVADPATGTITTRDLPTGAQTALTGAGTGPADAAVDAESALAFFSMAGSNEVAVIDYIRRQVVTRLAVGAKPGRIDPAPPLPAAGYRVLHGIGGHELGVSNDAGASVSVIDGQRLMVRATLGVGQGAHAMAFTGAKAYVANAQDGTVSVIDRRGGTPP
jgi:DNA-binding beta-propeller fold protein YncE